MKKGLKVLMAAAGIAAIISPNVHAAPSEMIYDIKEPSAIYKILLDGQSLEIPDVIEYPDGHKTSLEQYKEMLEMNNTATSTLFKNDTLTYNGNVLNATITSELVPVITNEGLLNKDVEQGTIINYFEKYQLLPHKQYYLEMYKEKLNRLLATPDIDPKEIDKCNSRISTYTEDVARLENVQAGSEKRKIYGALPYVDEVGHISEPMNLSTLEIKTEVDLQYYLYTILFRDLRLINLTYSVNSGEYKTVPKFNKDVYSYTVKLPENTPNDATIATRSTGYMQYVLDSNKIMGYDMGIEVQDKQIKLRGGVGTATVKVVFKVKETYGSYLDTSVTSNPERIYNVNFTKYDYLKGDLTRDGKVNAADATKALELFKNGNATEEDLMYGDMDGRNGINANDATMILELFKNSTIN